MLRLAGKIADGVILNSPTSTEYARRAADLVIEGVESSGRRRDEVDIACCIDCAVSESSEEAKDIVRPIIATYLAHFPAIAKESQVNQKVIENVRPVLLTEGSQAAAELIDDQIVNSLTAVGTEKEFTSRLEEYVDASVALLILCPHGTEEQIGRVIKACADHTIQNN